MSNGEQGNGIDTQRTESLQKTPLLTAVQVRFAPEEAVRQEVVLKLQEQTPFGEDVVKSLFARQQEHFLKAFGERTQEVIWPDTALEKPATPLPVIANPDGSPYIYSAIAAGKFISSVSIPFGSEADALARNAFKTLSLGEKKDVLSYLVKIRYVKPQELIADITHNDTEKPELLAHMMHVLFENRGAYTYPNHDLAKDNYIKDNIDPIVEAIAKTVPMSDIVQAIMQQPEDEQLQIAGICMDAKGIAAMLNGVRHMLEDAHTDDASKQKLEHLGKRLLGLDATDTRPFHTSLNSVYKELDFTNYEPNLAATQDEIQLIHDKVLSSLVIPQEGARVMDIGSGTGRTTLGLAKLHDARIKSIVGVDNSPTQLATAQKAYAQVEQNEKTPVIYEQVDWNDAASLAQYEKSVNLGIVTGRSLTHVESIAGFKKNIGQMLAVLRDDGVLLCDFPDPNKGAYKENRMQSLRLLQHAGIPLKDNELPVIEHVVDSADGKNLYNRYVPQFETVDYLLENMGYAMDEVGRAPIAGTLWEGSENVYFLIRKKKDQTTAA